MLLSTVLFTAYALAAIKGVCFLSEEKFLFVIACVKIFEKTLATICGVNTYFLVLGEIENSAYVQYRVKPKSRDIRRRSRSLTNVVCGVVKNKK